MSLPSLYMLLASAHSTITFSIEETCAFFSLFVVGLSRCKCQPHEGGKCSKKPGPRTLSCWLGRFKTIKIFFCPIANGLASPIPSAFSFNKQNASMLIAKYKRDSTRILQEKWIQPSGICSLGIPAYPLFYTIRLRLNNQYTYLPSSCVPSFLMISFLSLLRASLP